MIYCYNFNIMFLYTAVIPKERMYSMQFNIQNVTEYASASGADCWS